MLEFPANFIKAYIGRRHFLRGAYGFMTAMNFAFYRYLRVAKHLEAQAARSSATGEADAMSDPPASPSSPAAPSASARPSSRGLPAAGYGGRHPLQRLARRSGRARGRIWQAGGARTAVVAGDLGTPAVCSALVEARGGALGPLTLLVNNASLFESDTLAGSRAPTRWDRHFAVNLRAPVLLAQAFAAQAAQADDPSIVNIVDQRVLQLTPQFFSYTLTKAALHAATTTMAQALAPRIRVNAVGPGPTAAQRA